MQFSTFWCEEASAVSAAGMRSQQRALAPQNVRSLAHNDALTLHCAWCVMLSLKQQQKHTCWKWKRPQQREQAHTLNAWDWTGFRTSCAVRERSAYFTLWRLETREANGNNWDSFEPQQWRERSEKWMSMNVVYRFLVEFCYFTLKYVRALRTDCERSVWNCWTCAACQKTT